MASYPVGTRFWKEFSFGQKVETRFLEKGRNGTWSFATYVWNEAATEAVRAPDRLGLEQPPRHRRERRAVIRLAVDGLGYGYPGGAPVLRRVTFRDNGGNTVTFVGGSAGVVEDALFEQNRGTAAATLVSSPVFRRSTFRDNVLPTSGAGTHGPGAFIQGGAPRFEDCLFEGNRAACNFIEQRRGRGFYGLVPR